MYTELYVPRYGTYEFITSVRRAKLNENSKLGASLNFKTFHSSQVEEVVGPLFHS
jgi:hypothetical protein